jgi:hypothetical protein
MKDEYWENCPYSESRQCPQPDAIARAYLIPQLLNPSEIEATKKLCRTCGKYLNEKRKHPRVKRPFQINLQKSNGKTIEGYVANISEGGALIKLQDWADFEKNEGVILEIYPSHGASEKVSTSRIKVSGMIKRIEDEKDQLAIIFVKEIDR